MEAERDKYKMINFEETELRLGLPLSGNETLKNTCSTGKRVFSDTAVDLKLNLSSTSNSASSDLAKEKNITAAAPPANDPAKPPAKLVFFFLLPSTNYYMVSTINHACSCFD